MVVGKAVHMAQAMNVPILGIVENMSYFECPDCGKRHEIFGASHLEEAAASYGIDLTEKIPMIPANAALCDAGEADKLGENILGGLSLELFNKLKGDNEQ